MAVINIPVEIDTEAIVKNYLDDSPAEPGYWHKLAPGVTIGKVARALEKDIRSDLQNHVSEYVAQQLEHWDDHVDKYGDWAFAE